MGRTRRGAGFLLAGLLLASPGVLGAASRCQAPAARCCCCAKPGGKAACCCRASSQCGAPAAPQPTAPQRTAGDEREAPAPVALVFAAAVMTVGGARLRTAEPAPRHAATPVVEHVLLRC